MEQSELMTILIQTGFNIERMFEDKAIKEPAYKVLKYRNDLAIAELERALAKTSDENSNCNKPLVMPSGFTVNQEIAIFYGLKELSEQGQSVWDKEQIMQSISKNLLR